MRGCVLTGGGSRGSWQIGALYELVKATGGFDYYAGTSVGAINALTMAMFPKADALVGAAQGVELWSTKVNKTTDVWKHRFPPYAAALWKPSLGKTDPLWNLLREVVDQEQIRTSGVKLHIPAVDLYTGAVVVYNEYSPDIVQATMSSATFPLYFPPVEVEDRLEVDGGIAEFAPLRAAIDAGCTEVWVVSTQAVGRVRTLGPDDLRNTVSVGLRVVELLLKDVVLNDFKTCNYVNALVQAGLAPDKLYVDNHLVTPSTALHNPLNFDGDIMKAQIEVGKQDMLRHLENMG